MDRPEPMTYLVNIDPQETVSITSSAGDFVGLHIHTYGEWLELEPADARQIAAHLKLYADVVETARKEASDQA